MNAYNISNRFGRIRQALLLQKIDCFLLSSGANVSYACGFHAPDSYLIASQKGLTIITDFRYAADFRKMAKPPVSVAEINGTVFKTIRGILKKKSLKTVGFESRHLAFAECQALHELSKGKITWIPLKETIEPLREIKEDEELVNIRKAVQITLRAYDFIEKKLKAGMRELRVAAELERFIRLAGATSASFDIIVASGPNSSYPHAQITGRPMKNGEPVIIDMGVTVNGYKSDLTRTFFLGRINPVVRKIDTIVLQAQQMAIKAIKPGVLIRDIDGIARNYIKDKGFGKNFGHSLGHGVGLEVHEAPSINGKNGLRLKKGMVFTVEPGIYIAGSYGVRREEMVLVTSNGVEVLSGISRH
ncbi:MAG TPA: Xaa-Pro dipeptidase [Candidatus Omnitrophica bacterium]|nr:Xaa-Pro dipeptidase [Candidatus Omnitrophota bacterium]